MTTTQTTRRPATADDFIPGAVVFKANGKTPYTITDTKRGMVKLNNSWKTLREGNVVGLTVLTVEA